MSDELMLLAKMWPLTVEDGAGEAQAWGVSLTGPESIERLSRGAQRDGLFYSGGRWKGRVWANEAVVMSDLTKLGWRLADRRAGFRATTLVLSRPSPALGLRP